MLWHVHPSEVAFSRGNGRSRQSPWKSQELTQVNHFHRTHQHLLCQGDDAPLLRTNGVFVLPNSRRFLFEREQRRFCPSQDQRRLGEADIDIGQEESGRRPRPGRLLQNLIDQALQGSRFRQL